MLTILTAFATACVVAFLATPPVRRLAEHFDVIDKPDRHRKRHRRLIPLWGGLAIFIAFGTSLWVVLAYCTEGQMLVSYRNALIGHRIPFIIAAVGLLTFVGLWDDRRPLPPKVKLLVQLVAVSLVVFSGFQLKSLVLPLIGAKLTLWWGAGVIISLGWLIFVINAFNFTDGLDGLASSQAVVSGCALALGALNLAHQAQDLVSRYHLVLAAVLAAGAAGASLGFFRFNHFPARIFLGDAGSNLLGFLLSFSGLIVLSRATSSWQLLFVFLALGWPIFDTIQVIIRRWRRGDPISKADNRHLHHFLLGRGFTNSSAVAFINMIVIILCLVGLAATWL